MLMCLLDASITKWYIMESLFLIVLHTDVTLNCNLSIQWVTENCIAIDIIRKK